MSHSSFSNFSPRRAFQYIETSGLGRSKKGPQSKEVESFGNSRIGPKGVIYALP
jgi:hypothetical protein